MTESLSKKRIHYIDSGRALASILGIFFHSALVFSSPWIINIDSSQFSQLILIFQRILTVFRMPLFLFVAGFFTINALRKYNIIGFLIHRARRIFLPFAVSVVVLIPFHEYFRLLFKYGSDWLGHYLTYINPLSAEFDMLHLWFLYDLLIYAILICFIEILSRRFGIPKIIKQFTEHIHRRFSTTLFLGGGINIGFGFAGFVIASRLNISSAWIPLGDLGYNLPMFLFGCYCFINKERLDSLIHPLSHRIIGTIIVIGILFPLRLYLGSLEFAHSWRILLVIDIILRWIMTLGVLSLLKMFLNYGRPALDYLSEASYPVYLFHQPVIVAVTYFYVNSEIALPSMVGYFIVCLTSLILTYLAYEIIVRRNRVGAFLFTGTK